MTIQDTTTDDGPIEDLAREIDQLITLRDERAELLAVLQACAEVLDDYVDVHDGADGQPVPNRAMAMLRDVRAVLAKAEGGAR